MHTKSVISLSIAALVLSFDVILAKHILNLGVAPLVLLAAKTVVAGILLFVFIITSEHKRHLRFPKRHFTDLILIGAVVSVVGPITGLVGLQLTTATNLAFLRLTPLVVALLSYFILQERLPGRFWTLLLAVFLGIFLLSTQGTLAALKKGDALVILSSVFYGFGSVWTKKTMSNVRPLIILLGRYFFGSVILVTILFLFAAAQIASLSNAVGLVVLSGLLAVLWAALSLTVVEREGASVPNAFMRINPVLVAILGFIFLGETLSLIQILGASLILFSSYRISRLKATYLPTGT